MDLSIVVPMYNEEDNVDALVNDIVRACGALDQTYEIILVDDGSVDGTEERLAAVAATHPQVRVLPFARNYGQTAAMAAGLEISTGKVIVMMDGDRQNDPEDIPALLAKLDEGYDLVSGWRKNRQDSTIRKIPSRIANRLISRVTGVRLHDYGCTLKAYRQGFLDPGDLFGEMHRFLPVYVAMNGGRITEMVVNHHPRRSGVSKYGLNRTFRVIADLVLIRLLQRYSTRPLHGFAKATQACWVFAAVMLLVALVQGLWTRGQGFFGGAFVASAVGAVGGMVMLGQGLVAEYAIRARYQSTGQRPWRIREEAPEPVGSADPKAAVKSPPTPAPQEQSA
jgi:glycosyltransferase involved in cell wall biosynthesis